MLSTLDRYLIKELLLTFCATLLVMLAMALSNRLAGYLSQAASGLLARDAIWLLLGLQSIRFTGVLTPLALLLSTMLTLGKLYRDNEMAAITACGLGPGAIYRPLFWMTVPIAVMLAGLSFYLLPLTMKLQLEVQSRARQDAEVSVFTPGTFREVGNGEHVIYVDALAAGGQELRKVFVRSLTKEGTTAITTGNRGRQEINPESGVRYLILEDGHRYEGNAGQTDYRYLRFQKLSVQVESAPPEQIRIKREAIPTAQLWNSPRADGLAELHERLSSPLSVLLIAFSVPLLAHAHPREGRYGRVVAAILIYAIYFNLLGVGASWLARNKVWPILGLWWVHGLLALLGLSLWLYHYGAGIRLTPRAAGT